VKVGYAQGAGYGHEDALKGWLSSPDDMARYPRWPVMARAGPC